MRATLAVAVVWTAGVLGAVAAPAEKPVNLAPDLALGADGQTHWKVAHGQGKRVGRETLAIHGGSHESDLWQSEPIRLQPGSLYHFEVRAKRLDGAGSIIAGPSFANRDFSVSAGESKRLAFDFQAPVEVGETTLHLGVWEATGTVQFDQVRLVPVIPVHQQAGHLVLGDGESIRDGRYQFAGTFGHATSNYHRTLERTTASFNSDRFTLSGRAELVYRFGLPGTSFRDGQLRFNVNYRVRGGCEADVSRDGRTWQTVAKQEKLGTATVTLPKEFFPTESLLVRLRTTSEDTNLQINEVSFEAALSGNLPDVIGQTVCAEIRSAVAALSGSSRPRSPQAGSGEKAFAAVDPERTGDATDGRRLPHAGTGDAGRSRYDEDGLQGQSTARCDAGECRQRCGGPDPCRASRPIGCDGPRHEPVGNRSRADVAARRAGLRARRLRQADRRRGRTGGRLVVRRDAQDPPPSRLADGGQPRRRVFRRAQRPRGGTDRGPTVASVEEPHSDGRRLAGPSGASIPASQIQILREYYHYVTHPTDSTGTRDWWPDALPPLSKPIDITADEQQPLWVLVSVPKDAPAGDYQGSIALKADGWSAAVPIRLHVWNFTLPDKNHLETAFGFSPHEVFRYHNIKTEADKRTILDLYFQNFAAHRISPYDPTPLDPIRVKFLDEAQPPRAEVDFRAFDSALSRAIAQYHFTNFQLPIQGMGGGTFEFRVAPGIGRDKEESPEYQALFASQVQQLEAHLREKGWLKMAFVYWFDRARAEGLPVRSRRHGPDQAFCPRHSAHAHRGTRR